MARSRFSRELKPLNHDGGKVEGIDQKPPTAVIESANRDH